MSKVEVTVGIDIGTSSVKALAVDADGKVMARARVPHEVRIPSPESFEHDVDIAWSAGPKNALAQVSENFSVKGVSVAAMVPSLAAVDSEGRALSAGLLYGDERGRTGGVGLAGSSPAENGELFGFVRACVTDAPNATGLWPAQAVANYALSKEAVLDTATASTAMPLFDGSKWDSALIESAGARVEQFPSLAPTGAAIGRVGANGPFLASGCIDAFAEQLVAGADGVGDVLVILGTTLIVWAVVSDPISVPGYWTIPHTASGTFLVGGPSNAGGLFWNWATSWLAESNSGPLPDRVPVWEPYPRGERTPFHDPHRRGVLFDLDLTHGPAALRRAAFEASGFVVRRVLDGVRQASAAPLNRIVATGGGTRVDEWVQAVADATAMPIDCVAVPEGGALGSAWLARIAAGLEDPHAMTEGRRWARTGRRVEADPKWIEPVAQRYDRFVSRFEQ